MTVSTPGPVAVMGAGSVGCFVGGRLQAAGARVHYVGRPRVLGALKAAGLNLSDCDSGPVTIPAHRLHLHEQPPSDAALVLLCVKSGATAEAAAQLAARLPPGTPVLSLQNGVSNVQVGEQAAPGLVWIPGMVPFNIAETGPGRFHRGTTGQLAAQDHAALRPWLPLFEAANLQLQLHADMAPVQWGKLLLNLNNPVNALSGLPLRAQLLDRDYRTVLAALQAEALNVMRSAGIRPASLTPLPPALLVHVLRLPTWLFRLVAARMLKIDDKARSSMADDLALGRATEVDALCGAVVRLAREHKQKAPLNARMLLMLTSAPAGSCSGRRMRHDVGC
jgi:2-dehydropantoate 2-reductase